MKVDCQWFNEHLEGLFCESLDANELRQASEHLNTCAKCSAEVQALRDIDPMIQRVMAYRTVQARAAVLSPTLNPKRGSLSPRPFRIGIAFSGLALAATLVFAVFVREGKDSKLDQPVAPASNQTVESTEATTTKTDSAPTLRAKPDAAGKIAAATSPVPEAAIPENAPDFSVIDPAGYSTTLQDYRGRVVLIGVWSADQPESAQNLQRLYQAFGTRKEVRMLGISKRKQERPSGTTFPMVFNNGSKLLGAQNEDYLVVDKEGRVQMRGSLSGDSNALVSRIRKELDQLGAR